MGDSSEIKRRVVVTIVSGKGGVGKSLIAVNLARLISQGGARVLLVDLDIYGRGATTLVKDEKGPQGDLTSYWLVSKAATGQIDRQKIRRRLNQELLRVTDDLLLLPGAPTSRAIDPLEFVISSETQIDDVSILLKELPEMVGADVTVMDCEPGADALVLAAVKASTRVLIVSEPDVVTWDATLQFWVQIQSWLGAETEVYFVINKVPRRYALDRLGTFYQEQMSGLLRGLRIAAAIPFEYEVLDRFGETGFLIDDLRHSEFARGVGSLANLVLEGQRQDLIGPSIVALSKRRPQSLLAGRLNRSTLLVTGGASYALIGFIILAVELGGLLDDPIRLAGLTTFVFGLVAVIFGLLYGRLRSP